MEFKIDFANFHFFSLNKDQNQNVSDSILKLKLEEKNSERQKVFNFRFGCFYVTN